MVNTLWPVLKSYETPFLRRIAMPLGGLGTGCVSLGGRGELRDWEVMNRPAKGYAPNHSLFVVRCKAEGEPAIARVLEGALDDETYQGSSGCYARQAGWPRFRQARFEAAFPFGQVVLRDDDVPLEVRLQAFNPLIPGDVASSEWPVATLCYQLKNTGDKPLEVSLCGILSNFIGHDGTQGKPKNNRNEWRDENGLRGIFMCSDGVEPNSPQWGTMSLSTPHDQLSYRLSWPKMGWWQGEQQEFWDDFLDDGKIEYSIWEVGENDTPTASLCAQLALQPGETREITFYIAWHFPNRQSWTPLGGWNEHASDAMFQVSDPIVGNFYTTRWRDAWHVAQEFKEQHRVLEERTLQFVDAFCDSDLPSVVKEAALFNLSTLKTQTVFRTPDGNFFGWEGTHDHDGSCWGNCTHVWNYESATPFLFGEMARSMRELEWEVATNDVGAMSYRIALPLGKSGRLLPAADGQLGCIVKLWREWQLCGDDAWLRRLWPHARRGLEFCWIEGGWDGDRDGVMEGSQHNTMDVQYYGPNAQMQGWYLAALRAGEEMARYLGENDLAATCADLRERGKAWTDAHLWNGEYYEQEIRAPLSADKIAPALRASHLDEESLREPKLQLGDACLVDQLVGAYMANLCGFAPILDEEHMRECWRNVVRFNRRENMHGHFNGMRSYALGDESALLMATYPRGNRPQQPFPYWNETMTGFEYVVAFGLMQQGDIDEGLRVVSDIRARYDGKKRSPFDEAECGHHYARAMASWSCVLALTNFEYSNVTKTVKFGGATRARRDFWSNGAAWGTFSQTPRDDGNGDDGNQRGSEIELRVLHGALDLQQLELRGVGTSRFDARRVSAGATLALFIPHD